MSIPHDELAAQFLTELKAFQFGLQKGSKPDGRDAHAVRFTRARSAGGRTCR